MKSKVGPLVTTWLLAGLVLVSAGAEAQGGFTVSRSRENVVAVGMSMADVQRLLGRPYQANQYGNAPGPVWTYRVVDPLFGKTVFNVDFGADGRVMTTGEVVLGSDSPNRGRD